MQLFVLMASSALVAVQATGQITLTKADRSAVFRAAGFSPSGSNWTKCGDPGTASYTPGTIEWVRDVNGDKLPEALVTEGSSFCHGTAETGFTLVSKQPGGAWRPIISRSGVATLLATHGVGGWPDLEVGGPGFCFAVERWNGREYRFNRRQYNGKPCT